MNVKTFKRITKRSLSMLLSVLMVLSIFTVCMVGGTLSASAYDVSGATIYFDNSNTAWSNVSLYIGNGSYLTRLDLTQISGTNIWKTTVSWVGYDNYFFSNDTSYSSGSVYNAFNGISASNKTEQISATINSNTIVTAESGSPYGVTFSTTNTITALDGYVYFNKPDDWSNVYLYIGRDNSPYTSRYSLTLVSGTIYRANVSGWASTTEGVREAFYFSENSVASSSTAITTRYNNDSGDKTQLYYCAFEDITTDNVYTPVGSSSPYDTTVSVYTDANTFWVDATLYNYRNQTQISENSDYANGQANQPFDAIVFGEYNTAVSDWYRKAYTTNGSATNKNITATPLYQGNFRENTTAIAGDVTNTIGYVKNELNSLFYWFVSVANGANRYGGHANGYGTKAAAINLVDEKLNDNGTITQNGVELPQFSDTFMETYNNQTVTGMYAVANDAYTSVSTSTTNSLSKTFGNIQTKYEGLKFQFKTTETTAGNKKYSYQANDGNGNSVDGNRYYDATTNTIRKGEAVYGCANDVGAATTNPGYFPFNSSNPSDKSQVVNSFGTRFDIEFTMPSANSGTGYQLQGTTGTYEDLTFTFEGDDDVWVYVDGYLALDLGGSHNNAKGYINLSKFKSKIESGYYDATSTNTKTNQYSAGWAYTNENSAVEKALSDNLIASLKDTNKPHTLTVFYLERGMFDSNFKMEFLLPQSNKLKVDEAIDDTAVNAGLKEKTLAVANKDLFDVQVKSNSTSTPKDNSVTLPLTTPFTRNGETLQQIGTTTGTVNNTPTTGAVSVGANAYYSWTDTSGKAEGSGVGVPNNGSMYLLYDQSGTFNDQFAPGCNVSVVQSDALRKFGTTYNAGTGLLENTDANRKVSDFYDTTYTVKDVYGEDVAVTASSSGRGGQFVYHNNGNKNENQILVDVGFTNKIKTGSISMTKKTDGSDTRPEDQSREYTFKLEICNLFGDTTDTAWAPASGLVGTNVSTSTEVTLGADGTFGIKKDQTVQFDGIPVGTSYRITEVVESDANYGISTITSSSSTDFVNVGNSFEVTNKTTSDDKFEVTNTYSATKVIFRFYDRKIVDGVPTGMETHYTYFTKEIPGNLLNGDALASGAAAKIESYAPTIKNVFKTYTITDADITYDTWTPQANEEGIGNLVSGTKYIIATYQPHDRTYTSNFTLYNEDGSIKNQSVTKGYNELITIDKDHILASPQIMDISTEDDTEDKKNFLYWAKEVDVYTGDRVETYWTPVTANYFYSQRVTDDGNYLAVYEGDVINGSVASSLSAPYETHYKSVMSSVWDENEGKYVYKLVDLPISYQPANSGYDASTNERIYDSYTIDEVVNSTVQKVDRTRVNVIFGSVGSPDSDTKITNVGYILFRNDGSYPDTSQLSSDLLKAAAQAANGANTGGKQDNAITSKTNQYAANATVGGKTTPYRLMVTDYLVNNVMSNDNYESGVDDYVGYNPNQVNLTNKNRLNIVFDIANTEATQKGYYTCYTYMYRNGNLYISPTPATFNLKDAEPMLKDPDAGKKTYPVEISSVDTDGKATSYGNVTSNFTSVTEGKMITLTVKTALIGNFMGKLTKLQIGNKTVDNITAIESGGTYTYTFSTDDIASSDTSLKIKATFDSVSANGVRVILPTVDNCTIKSEPTGDFIEYNNSITVTVTPNSGYAVSEANGFTVNSTTGVATKTITVTSGMKASELTAAMTPTIMETPYKLTVKASAGGSVTVTAGAVTKTVAAGKTEVISVDKASPTVTLSATPATNYEFTSWTGATPDASGNITVSSDMTVTANFTKVRSTFKVVSNDTTMGTITDVSVGDTKLTADSNGYYTAAVGATVSITATPTNADDYEFASWSKSGGNSVASTTSATTTFKVSSTDGAVYTATFKSTAIKVYFAFINQNWNNPYPRDVAHKNVYTSYGGSYSDSFSHDGIDTAKYYWYGVNAYMYNSSTNVKNDSWPGVEMTYEGVYSSNKGVGVLYSIEIDETKGFDKLIFSGINNSGNEIGKQTTTIDLTGSYADTVYFANGGNETDGKFTCDSNKLSAWTYKGK